MNSPPPEVDRPSRLTVAENLTVYGHLYGLSDIGARIRAVAADLDITEFLNRTVRTLSAGQKTRVALSKALLNRPSLLLLDEPTASLDPDTADWVRHYLKDYQRNEGATILLASHNMIEVERICDLVMIMRRGRIVERGEPHDLIARYGRSSLEDVFLDISRRRDAARESAAQ